MKSSTIPALRIRFLSTVLLLLAAFPADIVVAQTDFSRNPRAAVNEHHQRRSDRHPYEGFLQPVRTIEVAASDSGRVAAVAVRRGDTVTAGQLLLRLDTTVLETSRKVAAAQADAVAKNRALKVEHSTQQSRLTQIQALADADRASSEELLRAKADEQVALFHLQAAEEERTQRQLAVEEITARITARSIVSPIDGTVTEVGREIGEFVSPSNPEVVTVVDLRQLRASFFLPTLEAVKYQRDAPVIVTVQETSQQLKGNVEYVGATTEAESGRVRLDVLIGNSKGRYRSGMRCVLDVAQSPTSPNAPRDRPFDEARTTPAGVHRR